MKYEATTSRTRKVIILVVMTALLTLAYIFGASPHANNGAFGTLQAQGSNGTITGLALTSDTPGTLTVSWDTTSPVPTDYRVDWAKSDEEYTSWKVDEGHKYPAPTATAVTIADLEHDTEYKVRMRARYYRGEHEDSPWGGPWAEATIQVAGTPEEEPDPPATPEPAPSTDPAPRDSDPPKPTLPAAPTFINTAVTEGQVLLAWSNPSDDSITGYQILRGPDAKNMVVIEDNTGSTSTSYTDTAPPAGQTHTYGVKARNSAGLSPAGTATATVPAAEEEEEPAIAEQHDSNDYLVSNFGVASDTEAIISNTVTNYISRRANSFSAANAPGVSGRASYRFDFDGIAINARNSPGTGVAPINDLGFTIHSNNSGEPGGVLYTLIPPSNFANTAAFAKYNLAAPADSELESGVTYWFQIAITGGSHQLGIDATKNGNDEKGPTTHAQWSIGDSALRASSTGPWEAEASHNRTRVMKMEVLGTQQYEQNSEPANGDLAADNTTIGHLILNSSGVTGLHQEGVLNVDPPIYDVDWFAFMAEANTDYQFTANQGQRHPRLNVLRIYNDAGVEQRNSEIAGTTTTLHGETQTLYSAPDRLNSIAFQSDTAGIYYVSIESWNGNSSKVAYTLTMSDDDYPDDVTTTAIVAVSESGQNFKDFHNYLMRTDADPDSQTTNDVDWIRVALKEDVPYEIVYDVGCLHRGIIEGIYDPDGDIISGTDLEVQEIHANSGVTTNLCANLVTEFTPSLVGGHYIAVSAKAPTVVAACDPDCTVTRDYPFQGVQGTLTITDPTAPPRPNSAATGDTLVRGERRVGSTLTADTAKIADANGLTNPMFEYHWQRMEDGTPAGIPGEVSDTYILTDDDLGKRIQLQIRTTDDDGYGETRSGPATSIVTATNPRVLVSNLFRGLGHSAATDASSAFLTGLNPHGYVIDTVTMPHAHSLAGQPAEYRLYRSRLPTGQPVSASYPDLRTGGLLMSASPPERINGLNLTFGASSKVKLTPNTPYQNVLTSTGSNRVGCALSMEGVDSDSLTGFSIPQIARTYGRPTSVYSNACLFRISGFELTTSFFVKKVEITSTPDMEGMYATGEIIEVTATLRRATPFAEPSPALLLQIGENERQMEYVASSSTNTSWVFRYTVTADDRDDDGISFERNALRGYADADLSHRGMNSDPGHHVNAVPQLLSHRVSSKPVVPPWYTAGDQIKFILEFSLPVTVAGDPQLEFAITVPGPQNEFASYESGSGTKELVFSYTVLATNDDADGIWWNADSLRLDSDDSITGRFNGLDANLDHTALNKLEDHRIDQNPRAVSMEVTSDPMDGPDSDTYGAGDVITIKVVFNQAVTVAGAPRLRFSISSGTGPEYADYVSGSTTDTLTFSYTVLAADADADGIYLYTAPADDPLDYPDADDDSITGITNSLPAINSGFGDRGRVLPEHKVDGSITN